MDLPFLLCAGITLISSLVSLGYALAAIRGQSNESLTLALYALSRSVALAAIAALAFLNKDLGWLYAAAIAMIVTQAGDAVVGCRTGEPLKVLGPLFTALANLAALLWLGISQGWAL